MKYFGSPGKYKISVDERSYTELCEHELFLHNEPLMISDVIVNITENYPEWSQDEPEKINSDGLLFLIRRCLKEYQDKKKKLAIIRLVWYAVLLLRYGVHSPD